MVSSPLRARERVWGHWRDFLVVHTNIASFLWHVMMLVIFKVGIVWAPKESKTSLFITEDVLVRHKVSTTKKALQCHQTLFFAEGWVWT